MNFIKKLDILKDKWSVLILSLAVYIVTSLILICTLPLQQSLEMLFLLVYMTFACTFFPLPTPQIIMDFGGRFDPLLVAIIGAIGTCIAGLIDYTAMDYILKYEKIAKLKQTKIYKYCTWLYNKVAFISLVIAGFTPIPFEPFRFLAAATKYNRGKYALAIFIGRAPRYYILGKFQRMLHIPRSILIGSILLLLIVGLIRMLWKRKRQKKTSRGHALGMDVK
ncbi:TPA: hypothetical protein EYP66_02290 [Candidatus Poribacteria bacterium]|nr:hypothetical protein [Candidatus Poribacteria bacterium]